LSEVNHLHLLDSLLLLSMLSFLSLCWSLVSFNYLCDGGIQNCWGHQRNAPFDESMWMDDDNTCVGTGLPRIYHESAVTDLNPDGLRVMGVYYAVMLTCITGGLWLLATLFLVCLGCGGSCCCGQATRSRIAVRMVTLCLLSHTLSFLLSAFALLRPFRTFVLPIAEWCGDACRCRVGPWYLWHAIPFGVRVGGADALAARCKATSQ
jgi:hypothetical protein